MVRNCGLNFDLLASDIMTIGVIVVEKEDPVTRVLELMDEKKISAVVVEDSLDLQHYYLISHSDIISYLVKNPDNANFMHIKAKELMHGPIDIIPPSTPIDKIVEIMFTRGFKRIIIGNDKKQPVGIVSTKDILAWNNDFFRPGNPILLAVMDNKSGIILTQKFFRKDFSQEMLELFGGSISAISTITSEVLQKSGNLRIIEKDYYIIMLEPRKEVTGILVADYQSIDLRRKLQAFIDKFCDEFDYEITVWKQTHGPTNVFKIRHLAEMFDNPNLT
jgi:CBS domain-containing protein